MALFGRNFNIPGPGIPKDMPRKTGIGRFFELLFRDFYDYIKLSALFCLVLLPSAAAFVAGAVFFMLGTNELLLLPLVISIPLAYPAGGALVGCYFNITRFMRDDPSYLWHEFKRKFKENYRQAAGAGMVCTVFIYLQILLWFQMYHMMISGTYTGGFVWILLAFLSFMLFSMITPYIFLQYTYINLSTTQIIKNSLLLTFLFLPRSFMGALCGNTIWILFALFMPNSMLILPFVPLIFMALSMLMTLSWIWPPFNKHFQIEETINQRRLDKEEASGEASEDGIFTDK